MQKSLSHESGHNHPVLSCLSRADCVEKAHGHCGQTLVLEIDLPQELIDD
jgi:hypothetical protein